MIGILEVSAALAAPLCPLVWWLVGIGTRQPRPPRSLRQMPRHRA